MNKSEIFKEIEIKLKSSDFKKNDTKQSTNIDKILLHKIFAPFIFLIIISSTLLLSFYVGQFIGDIGEYIIEKIKTSIENTSLIHIQKLFINEFLLTTTESVFSCSAQIFSIHFFISILKESGYLARGVFIVAKAMSSIGLSPDAFIPLISNFGCNVPGILATRTIKDKSVRLISIIVSPLISCPAKLPIYTMISGIYFSGFKQSLFILLIYFTGIILTIITSKILSTFIKREDNSFITEIPSYCTPNIKTIFINSISKSINFFNHIAPIIYLFTLITWYLNFSPIRKDNHNNTTYIYRISKKIEPSLSILGFDYKMDIALLSGICAKESIPATLKSLYKISQNQDKNISKTDIPIRKGISFLIFVMFYCPCINTLAVINKELGLYFSFILMIFYTFLGFFLSFLFVNFI